MGNVRTEPDRLTRLVASLRSAAIPVAAILASLALFGVFVTLFGQSPLGVFHQMFRGSFGTWFSFQNTLQRSAPLMLTALCTLLPARAGLIVIGGEGALVMGGLAAAMVSMALTGHASPLAVQVCMVLAGLMLGGLWVALSTGLRAYRGVNETIASLLLNYIAIAVFNHLVEGVLRDPESLNKPSTPPIADEVMFGNLPGLDVHVGLAFSLAACLVAYFLMRWTVFGFTTRIVGGNPRAAQLSGLPVARVLVLVGLLAGASAGLAGVVEVAAVQGSANASLITGYGYSGILVAFLARQQPLAVIPVAILLGGIGASGGLLQRMFQLPDASTSVLQGILFLAILFSETFQGRRLLLRRRAPATLAKPEQGSVVSA
jgi:ABC-type uncharacterized transport system permease subunit